jgi:DSF synthase
MKGPPRFIDLMQDRKTLPVAAARDDPSPMEPVAAALARQHFAEFDLEFDAAERILFCRFAHRGGQCLSEDVLREGQEVQRLVRGFLGDGREREPPVRFLVLASRAPGAWNLGADLKLFAQFIRSRDRANLRRYAHSCCGFAFANATGLGFDLPVVSVALVQGDALGAGFELALSSNLIVAERSAKFGLPEILFNLFPGMGAVSFLSRRIPPGLAERLILSGEIFSAEQLQALGAVDVLAPDGQGVAALHEFIGRRGSRYPALRALYRARRLVNPVTLEELTRIADLWVEAAFKLEELDLRKMLHLDAAQARRRAGENHHFATIRSN